MNRRRFIRCIGCGCALATVGCATHRGKAKGDAMSEHKPAADALSRPDWDVSVCGLMDTTIIVWQLRT